MRHSFLARKTDTIFGDRLQGDSRSEYFELTWGDDNADGGDGHDVFWDVDGSSVGGNSIWLASTDRIYGGAGDDLVYAGLGADSFDGGSGRDTLDYRYSRSAVVLDIGAGRGAGDAQSAATGDTFRNVESFAGSSYGDVFYGGTTDGLGLFGGAGNDRLFGGAEGSALFGGTGNDSFYGGGDDNGLMYLSPLVESYGGSGNDTFFDPGIGLRADGGAGDDLFYRPHGSAVLVGGDGFDTVLFTGLTTARLRHHQLDGIERVIGTAGGDDLASGSASGERVTVEGGAGNDLIEGGGGEDVLHGGMGRDSIEGHSGNDLIFGGDGGGALDGGAGNDLIRGGSGADTISGRDGRDTLWGESGDDRMTVGTDGVMMGGAGNDMLILGGAGVTASGDSGADAFAFALGAARQGRITDFEQGADRLLVDAYLGRFFLPETLVATGAREMTLFFDGKAEGRVDWVHKLGDTLVQLDRDLDGVTDYSLILSGTLNLTPADFIL